VNKVENRGVTMRVIAVYKDNYDYTRTVTEFLHDVDRRTGKALEIVDPDSVAGIQFCETYGIMQYPTILAMREDGFMQNMWTGLPLPTTDEISYYLQQN
jgi:hypothetical protein